MKVGEICREHGISDQTFYNWKAKYRQRKAVDKMKSTGISEKKCVRPVGLNRIYKWHI